MRKERDHLRARLRTVHSEAEVAQRRLSLLAGASKRFASSIRGGADARRRSRRRLTTQYALSRVLAEARNLPEAAPRILEILGEGLRWRQTVLWTVDEAAGVLRCEGAWRSPEAPPDGFEYACRRTRLPRGACLPGRVWELREPVWVEDLQKDEGFLRKEAAAEEGLRGAFAFPIRDGGIMGVLELLCYEPAPPDEDLMSTAVLIGYQIGQFLQHRRAEEERERLLVREREAREETDAAREQMRSVLESINDVFFALDKERRFAYVNREAERSWGRTREELVGRNLWEAFPQAVGSENYRAIEKALDEGEAADFEAVSPVMHAWISGRVYPSPGGVSVLFRDITERKRAEEAVRKSEERYRSLAEATSSVVWTAAPDGSCVEEMPAWEEFTGQAFEQYRGFGWLDAVHPEDRPESGRERPSPEDAPVEAEYRLLRHDGQYRRVVSRGVPILDESGGVREWVGTVTDVEEERRAEEELRETGAKLMGLFDSDVVGISWGEEERIVECNDAALRMFGRTREELLDGGLDWTEMTLPREQERIRQAVQEGKETGRITPFEKTFVGKDGSRVPTIFGGYCLSADPFRYVSFVLDIGDRKKAEEALKESEERLRSVAEGAPVILFALNRDGVFTASAGRGLETLGLGPGELDGLCIFDYFADEPEILEDVRRALSGEAFTVIRTVGGMVFETRYNPLRGPAGEVTGVIGVATDVTERIKAEEERRLAAAREREAREEAEAAQERLAFLAGAAEERQRISRELHDRVAHAMGVVHQSLELHGAFKEKKPALAEDKLQQARGLAKEALDSTRDLSMALRDSEVEEGMGPALSKLVGTTVPPGVRYAVSVEGDEGLVPRRVRDQIFLVLREAVRNAATHSRCASIAVEMDVAPGRVVGSVEDDGEGFDPQRARDGDTGGLRSMRERAEMVGGTCELVPGPDRGARVEIFVPLRETPPKEAR